MSIFAAGFAVMQDLNTWPADENAAHPGFEYLGTSLFPWPQNFTAAEYGAFLTSTSSFQVLESGLRVRLLAAVTNDSRQLRRSAHNGVVDAVLHRAALG